MEFSAEEFETALITPNSTLAEIHMPLLKVSYANFSSLMVSFLCAFVCKSYDPVRWVYIVRLE